MKSPIRAALLVSSALGLAVGLLSSSGRADDPPPAPANPPLRPMPMRPIRRPVLPLPAGNAPAAAPPAGSAPAAAPTAPVPLAPLPTIAVPAAKAGAVVPPPLSARPNRRWGRPRPPPAPPAGPRPQVSLTIDAPTLTGAWTMRVTNDGPVPLRLAADARLLSLTVTPRGEMHAVHCELPADMRPADALDRALVLPPGRSYAEAFEPRIYCFGERALRALSPQATVVARLGWPDDVHAEARQAVTPIDGVEPVVASAPGLVAAPIALHGDPTPVALDGTSNAGSDRPRLTLTSTMAVDAPTLADLAVGVTLRNDGSHPVRVRFTPETLAFDLATARGVERCTWPTPVGAPMRELFDTLPPGGAASMTVMISDYCNRKSFEKPGLVVLRAQLDTRKASGQDIGLQTFDGQVIANEPTVVRLHRGTGSEHLHRPQFEADKAHVDADK